MKSANKARLGREATLSQRVANELSRAGLLKNNDPIRAPDTAHPQCAAHFFDYGRNREKSLRVIKEQFLRLTSLRIKAEHQTQQPKTKR